MIARLVSKDRPRQKQHQRPKQRYAGVRYAGTLQIAKAYRSSTVLLSPEKVRRGVAPLGSLTAIVTAPASPGSTGSRFCMAEPSSGASLQSIGVSMLHLLRLARSEWSL